MQPHSAKYLRSATVVVGPKEREMGDMGVCCVGVAEGGGVPCG